MPVSPLPLSPAAAAAGSSDPRALDLNRRMAFSRDTLQPRPISASTKCSSGCATLPKHPHQLHDQAEIQVCFQQALQQKESSGYGSTSTLIIPQRKPSLLHRQLHLFQTSAP